jgi:hypothetical protein
MKKITRATFKSFIRKNSNLFINVKSRFDGMIDGCASVNTSFLRAIREENHLENTLGINGLWLVGGNDRFSHYEDDKFIGIEYYNCCGNGVIAIAK